MRKLLNLLLIVSLLGLASLGSAQETQVLTIRKFSGLATKYDPSETPLEYGQIVRNIRLNRFGTLDKRPLRNVYNATSLGDNPILFAYRFYYGSSKLLIISYSTFLKGGDDSAGTFDADLTSIKTGLTAGEYFQAVTYKDVFYAGNGVNANIHYDGTNIRDWGVAGPGETEMAGSEGDPGSIPDGTYKYQVTFVYDGYQESNPNTDTTSVTIAVDKEIDLTGIPLGTALTNVTARKLYRTQKGGSVYYYLTTIADNVDETYSDDALDGALDTTTTPPSTHYAPEICKYFESHKERIFAAGLLTETSRLYYSAIIKGISYPDIFPADNWIDISPDDGEKIMGIKTDPSGILCVFKQTKMYQVFTSGPPGQWELSPPYEGSGVLSPYSLVKTPYGIIFLSRSGQDVKEIRIFAGGSSKVISQLVEPELAKIPAGSVDAVYGVYHGGKYLLSHCDKTLGVTYNNTVLVLDIENTFFSIDTGKNIASFCVWNAGDDLGELYSGDSVLGKVYREDAKYQDIKHKLKSEFSGTTSQVTVGGTESAPTLELTAADLTNDYAGKAWEDISDTWTALSGDTQTWSYSGTYTSPALLANASKFVGYNWFETVGTDEDIWFRIKSAASSGALGAASYSSFYTGPTDVATSANTYIQYQYKLISKDIAETPTLRREGDYAVWVNLGLGTHAETSVNFEYATGELDLGIPFARKRLRQARTDHSGGETDFSIFFNLDDEGEEFWTVDLSEDIRATKKNFPYDHCFAEKAEFRITEDSDSPFSLKQLKVIFEVEPIAY